MEARKGDCAWLEANGFLSWRSDCFLGFFFFLCFLLGSNFNWQDIKSDRNKTFYLGNSLHADRPTWNNPLPNTLWYTKSGRKEAAGEELARIKREEELLVKEALGLIPKRQTESEVSRGEVEELTRKGQLEREANDPSRIKGLGHAPLGSGSGKGAAPSVLAGTGVEPTTDEWQEAESESKKLRSKDKKHSKKSSKKQRKKERKKERKKSKKKHKKRHKSREARSNSDERSRSPKRSDRRSRHTHRRMDSSSDSSDSSESRSSTSSRGESRNRRQSSRRRHDSDSE